MKNFTYFFILFFGTTLTALSQTVIINPIDSGPYGTGSSIAVPLSVTDTDGRLTTDNIFKLYISDASGSFATEKEIGSYKGFYTTFINGIIPSDLQPGNYKVRIKNSSTSVISAASDAFTVNSNNGVLADIDVSPAQTITANPKTFGICRPEKSTGFKFTNSSASGANVTATFINQLNRNDIKQFTFDSQPLNFTADMAHYTILVKAQLNGTIGTRAFFLINNAIKPGFNPPANNTVCLPTVLEFDIETNSSNGIQNNFPGYSYQINWGDNVIENVTPSQIIAGGGKVRHTYATSSCGKQIKINDASYYNVFGIIYQVNSPYCGLISVPLSTQAKVITKPENRFALPSSVCVNKEFTLNNTSVAGDNPSSNSPECTNNQIVYYWYVDGQLATPQGVPISYNLNHKFTSTGIHTIRLESESNSNCEAAPKEITCYVQEAPKPGFILNETIACVGTIIKATDNSVVDASEKAENSSVWTVKGPSEIIYVNGTSNKSKNPEFKFINAGIYTIQLTITSPCGVISSEQTVTINGKPTITANWQGNLCGKGQLLTFNPVTGNPVSTNFSGSSKTESDTYTWEITGGAFSFKNNTNAHSKEPSILFEDYGAYSIRITHQNNCGTQSLLKILIFNQSPTISAGADQTICAGSSIKLAGSITGGTASKFTWRGGSGSFSPSRNALNPVYTPGEDEILAGEVRLDFSVSTLNPAPCNLVEDAVIIKINPANKITGLSSKTICTNTAVNYKPAALLEGSTISWKAVGSSNATGFSPSGSGEIQDVLVNTDPTREAKVTYTLTPEKDNCQGASFTFTVTVTATPELTATAANATICSGKESTIILNSNLPGMRYTWTSKVSGSITGNSKQSIPVSLSAIKDSLTNTGNVTGSVTYTIIPENTTGCAGEPITVTVNVSASPGISTFSPDKTTGCSPLSVTFKNTTPGSVNTYYWDFGDGKTLVTSTNNPVNHIYESSVSKTFKARLITQTDCGRFTSEYTIRISPNTVIPELVVNGDEYEGCAPHTVKFFNNSKGAVLFKYDFGDGTIIETNRSPETIVHTFTKGGKYLVKLTASNGCSDTSTTEIITVHPQAKTDFSADLRKGCSSVTVKFQNKSTGSLSYLWDFGDGTVSTDINPVHTFTSKKPSYTVCLITTSSFGCKDTLRFDDYITVTAPPAVDFQVLPGETIQYPNYHFAFKNKTSGEVESRLWDFGDGNTSSQLNPEHSYADTGMYKVSLKVTNASGCTDTKITHVRITGTPGSLFVPNAFMPNSLTEELRTFKAKGSGIAQWHIRIFNKWGQMIWQSDKLDEKGVPVEGWDGTMFGNQAPQGIYFWEISAKYKNGTEWAGMIYNGNEPKKTGTINLIR